MENILSEVLYHFEIIEVECLPATLDTTNEYILEFTHCRGDMQKALSKSGIYSEIKRIAANSGITRRVYPHLFRKTTATNILKRGGTDSDAGEYLGHKPKGVTARHYAFRSEDHTVKIFESFVAMI